MINIRTFYLCGVVLMIASVVGSIWNAIAIWNTLTNLGAKLSTSTGVLFQLLWLGIFYYLYKITPKQQPKVVNSPEIEKMLNELNSKKEVIKNDKHNS